MLLTSWYVGNPSSQQGSGTIDDPWHNIGAVNSAIIAGDIEPGDILHFQRGDTFHGNLVFNGVGGSPGNPIILTHYGPSEDPAPVIHAGDDSGISIRNAGYFRISELAIRGSFDPDDMDVTSNGNGIEFISDLGLVAPVYEDIELHHLDISYFAGSMFIPEPGMPACAPPPQHNTGVGILFYALQPNNPGEARTHYAGITIHDVDVHHNEISGIFIDDSYGIDCDAPLRNFVMTHERVYIHHVEAYNQQPRARENPNDPENPSVGGMGMSLGAIEGAVVERNVVYNNGRVGYYIINGALGSHNSNHVLMQYNEVYGTTSTADGIGMGFDRWTRNSVVAS